MMQEAIKHMIPHKSGYIINIASTAGIRPFPTTAIYSASKAALISLTQSAAIEYAGNGLVINSISPGALERPNVQGWSEEVGLTSSAHLTEAFYDYLELLAEIASIFYRAVRMLGTQKHAKQNISEEIL